MIIYDSETELKYFKEDEFKRAIPACSLSDMDFGFMRLLDQAREYAGVPFKINSAYRSPEYEKSKGRSGQSRHCYGIAVDIACYTSDVRFRIVNALLAVGINRIGIASNYIHCDIGYQNANPLIWLY